MYKQKPILLLLCARISKENSWSRKHAPPPKSGKKGKVEHKKYKKRARSDEEELELLKFMEEEEDEQQLEVVTLGGQISFREYREDKTIPFAHYFNPKATN